MRCTLGRPEEIFDRIIKEGEAAIDEFIQTRQSEELFLDFKRSSDNGSRKSLDQNDRENFAKAISGFGNSEGGVLVWGIDCSKDTDYADVAHTKVPIVNPTRFRSWLEGVVSACTVPPHSGVRHTAILTDGKKNGFVATLIPKSNASPHQVVGKLQYYMRAGSSFSPVSHGLLAGMFGRRPQPEVYVSYTIAPPAFSAHDDSLTIHLGYLLVNRGPGIARDPFISSWVMSSPGDKCEISFDVSHSQNNWIGLWSLGRHISLISKPEIRLAPRSHLQPYTLTLKLTPPFSKQLSIDGTCGCDQAPPYRFGMNAEAASVAALHSDIKKNHNNIGLQEEIHHRLTKEMDRWYGTPGSYDPYHY